MKTCQELFIKRENVNTLDMSRTFFRLQKNKVLDMSTVDMSRVDMSTP